MWAPSYRNDFCIYDPFFIVHFIEGFFLAMITPVAHSVLMLVTLVDVYHMRTDTESVWAPQTTSSLTPKRSITDRRS
jgi:hypothetical protein